MALPISQTGLEYRMTIPVGHAAGATSIPAATTTKFILFETERALKFREVKVVVNSTIVSGHPLTNHMVAQLWNFTDSTKIAQATITGTTTGTALRRGVPFSIATTNQFLSSKKAFASANKTFEMRFVGSNSLSQGLKNVVVQIYADIRD